jgi:hypothetical protein
VKRLAADGVTVVFSYLRNETAWWPRFGWTSGHNLSADGGLLP